MITRTNEKGHVEVLCCPDTDRTGQPGIADPDVIGCGMPAKPEELDERVYDCPHCGIEFNEDAAEWKALMRYHFDSGNRTDGPIGLFASVKATSKKLAVEILQQALPEEVELRPLLGLDQYVDNVEFANVYINFNDITEDDVNHTEEPVLAEKSNQHQS